MFVECLRRGCPICGSLRLTRSARRGVLERILGVILLPYHCVERDHRFFKFRWLIEELTPYAQAMAGLKAYHSATANPTALSMPQTLLAPTLAPTEVTTAGGGPEARPNERPAVLNLQTELPCTVLPKQAPVPDISPPPFEPICARSDS
jgi:hypothetical protein